MLDTLTIYSIIIATILISAGLVGLYGRRTPEAVGVYSWVAGSLALGTFFLCLILRRWLPPVIGIAFANGCIIAGLGLIHRGVCQITERPWPGAWHATAFVIIVVTFALFFDDLDAGFRMRMLLSAIATAAQSTMIAFTFSRPDARPGPEEQRARRLSAWVFFAIALVQIGRAIVVMPTTASLDATLLSRNVVSYWSSAWFLFFSLSLPFLITYINEARVQHDLGRAVADLKTALAEVKTLEGLIPICASCRRIRETNDQWLPIEGYLEAHANVTLDRGVCPDCAGKA